MLATKPQTSKKNTTTWIGWKFKTEWNLWLRRCFKRSTKNTKKLRNSIRHWCSVKLKWPSTLKHCTRLYSWLMSQRRALLGRVRASISWLTREIRFFISLLEMRRNWRLLSRGQRSSTSNVKIKFNGFLCLNRSRLKYLIKRLLMQKISRLWIPNW